MDVGVYRRILKCRFTYFAPYAVHIGISKGVIFRNGGSTFNIYWIVVYLSHISWDNASAVFMFQFKKSWDNANAVFML